MFRESRAFMKGYPEWYFWTRFPRAVVRFYGYWLRDAVRGAI